MGGGGQVGEWAGGTGFGGFDLGELSGAGVVALGRRSDKLVVVEEDPVLGPQ